jgi:hypothetical protein
MGLGGKNTLPSAKVERFLEGKQLLYVDSAALSRFEVAVDRIRTQLSNGAYKIRLQSKRYVFLYCPGSKNARIHVWRRGIMVLMEGNTKVVWPVLLPLVFVSMCILQFAVQSTLMYTSFVLLYGSDKGWINN